MAHFSEAHLWPCKNLSWVFHAKMINSLYLLIFFAKNTLYMFGRILNTPLPIVMIKSDIKRFYTTSSQHALVGINLILGTILIFRSVHFILI